MSIRHEKGGNSDMTVGLYVSQLSTGITNAYRPSGKTVCIVASNSKKMKLERFAMYKVFHKTTHIVFVNIYHAIWLKISR